MITTDIFLWANHIDGMKRDLQVELFVFNKNYTPYSIRVAETLNPYMSPVFLYDVINFVNMGAGTGLAIRELENVESTVNILPHTQLEKVGRAETLLHLIETQRNDIIEFNQNEHEFKRIKGIVARYTHPVDKDVKFYIIKQLSASGAISSSNAWQINGGQFEPHSSEVTLKMPTDNQMLVVGGDLFIFNQSKFKQVFDYDIQQILQSDQKGEAISKHYRLNLPDLFNDFAVMARSRKSTLKKLLDVNTETMPDQETVLEIADEMQVQLMSDDNGAIILYDPTDLGTFLDIINDNYLQSPAGKHYLAKSKKPLEVAE